MATSPQAPCPGAGAGAPPSCSLPRRADGFRCLADIVVATPGRLVDHIDQTPGFSLWHLRFLVGCPPLGGRPGLGPLLRSAPDARPPAARR